MAVVVKLIGKRCVPRGERRRIGKALDDLPLPVEKLTLHTGNTESCQRRDAVSGHPVEHLILHDESDASPAEDGRGLLVNIDMAAETSQRDACRLASNRATDDVDFRQLGISHGASS